METLSIVIPVYRGESSLEGVVEEILAATDELSGEGLDLIEVLLVHDGAVDNSCAVIEGLAAQDERVRPIWLSRNFGQHAATLAGCASSSGDWIVTMDEDGMHDPATIPRMRAEARHTGCELVYARSAESHHAVWRNATSRGAKRLAEMVLGVQDATSFSSFRLLDGYVGRALAAYCGHGVYLDVALSWVFESSTVVPTVHRADHRPTGSGYTLRSLLTHFRRMTMTAGARPLRFAAAFGLLVMAVGLAGSAVVVFFRFTGAIEVPGWASVMVAMSAFFGTVLLVLGIIAEYLSSTLTMLSGRPPYLIVGRRPRRPE